MPFELRAPLALHKETQGTAVDSIAREHRIVLDMLGEVAGFAIARDPENRAVRMCRWHLGGV